MRCVSTRVLPEPAPATTSSGPFGREHGLPLGGIQVGEVLIGRGDGHDLQPSEPSRPAKADSTHAGRGGEGLLVRRLEHERHLRPVVEETRVAPDRDLRMEVASPPRGRRRSGLPPVR